MTSEELNFNPNPRRFEDVVKVAEVIRGKLGMGASETVRVGIVCGSGLGGLAAEVKDAREMAYSEIPGFPAPTVEGHVGKLVLGTLEGQSVACLAGRFHPYEGHELAQCVLPIRVMKHLGAELVVLTNAAGGLNSDLMAGDLMEVEDHIALPLLALRGPLVGPNDDQLGPRFTSLGNAYDLGLRKLLREAGAEVLGSGERGLRRGIYCMVGGPQFESPAELRMLRGWGADAVGMSVAHEAVAARHAGLKVVAFSLISNLAQMAPETEFNPHLHQEVLQAGREGAAKASNLLKAFLRKLPAQLPPSSSS